MLPHHQAAIDMAKTQLLYGGGCGTIAAGWAQDIITETSSPRSKLIAALAEAARVNYARRKSLRRLLKAGKTNRRTKEMKNNEYVGVMSWLFTGAMQ
jgi:hypothetical protein